MYKEGLPKLRNSLEKLREGFAKTNSKIDWNKLRIDPLLKHLESLEVLSGSSEFSREFSRLTRGVVMFHSDLVYFRTNIKELEKILQSEKNS